MLQRRVGLSAVALVAACVTLCAVVLSKPSPTALLDARTAAEEAAKDESKFKAMFLNAHLEQKQADGHEKLAAKDLRVQKSLQLAAEQLGDNDRAEQAKMEVLRRQQAQLDEKLQRLSALWQSQRTALEYASRQIQAWGYRVKQDRVQLWSERGIVRNMKAHLKALDSLSHNARKDLPLARKQVTDARKVLQKAKDAVDSDHAQMAASSDKAAYSLAERKLDLAKAEVAAKQAVSLETEAKTAEGKNAAHSWQLKKRADEEKSKSRTLQAKAAEAQNRAELLQAKASEARANMQMMKADVTAAQNRLIRESTRAAGIRRRSIEEGGLVGQLRAQKKRMGVDERTLSQVLAKEHHLRDTIRVGQAALRKTAAMRTKDNALDKAIRAEEQGVGDAEVMDEAKQRRDQAESHAVATAAAEHSAAAEHLRKAASAAAQDAADLVHRATMLVGFAQDEKRALGDQSVLRKVQAASALVH